MKIPVFEQRRDSLRSFVVALGLCLALVPAFAVGQTDVPSRLPNSTRIAVVPVSGDFYRGAPNLMLLNKQFHRVYSEPAIFAARLDDESARIVADIEILLGQAMQRKGFTVTSISPLVVPTEQTARLNENFWCAIAPRPKTTASGESLASSPASGTESPELPFVDGATDVADAAGVDVLVVARFWGWRKGSLSLPALGFTKSAAVLWVGLIDGATGELVWHDKSTRATTITVSKQEIRALDKLLNDALKSFH